MKAAFFPHDRTLEGAGKFPVKSLAAFVAAAVLLRVVAVLAWAFFPGSDVFGQLARVTIPLFVAIGLLMLNQHLLRRDGFPRDALGLQPAKIGWFFSGAILILPVILLIAATLWLLVPFHWERGSLTWTKLFWQTAEYFAGNLGEELAFRGYLLVLFTRYFGLTRALFMVALLFGIFHLPGLSGWAAVKMVCTTGVGSFLFAYGFVFTGSLWTAVGMHVFGNTILHHVLGMGAGASIFSPVLHDSWPAHYDPAFCAWMTVSITLSICAALVLTRLNRRDLKRNVSVV